MTLANRVRELTLTTGTGDITLGGAVVSHIRFGDAFTVGDTVTYVIEDGDNYEIGSGTLVAADTLERTTISETLVDGVYDKSGPGAIDLSGNALVFCAVTAEFLLDPNSYADAISEVTPGAGVLVDGVLMKDGTVSSVGDGSIGGDLVVEGITDLRNNLILQNNQEIRFFDAGGTQRTAIELDSSNNFNVGTSAGGDTIFRGTGYAEVGRITSAGAMNIAGSVTLGNRDVFRSVDDSFTRIGGGSSTAAGAALWLYGGSEISNPYDVIITSGPSNANQLFFDYSLGSWSFQGNNLKDIDELTVSGSAAFGDKVGVGGPAHDTNQMVVYNSLGFHIRLDNDGELGLVGVNSDGDLTLWAHGAIGDSVNIMTGDGDGTVVAEFGSTAATIKTRLDIDMSGGPWFKMKSSVDSGSYGAFIKPDGTAFGYIGGSNGAAISNGTANDLALRSEGALYLAANGNNVVAEFTSSLITFETDTTINGELRVIDHLAVGTSTIPSWSSSYTSIDLGQAASFMAGTASQNLLHGINWYWDGTNYKRKVAGSANRMVFNQSDIKIDFATSSDGTDTNISWSTALSLTDTLLTLSTDMVVNGDLDIGGSMTLEGANILRNVDNSTLRLSGSSGTGDGANMILYGGGHSLLAGDFILRDGIDPWFSYYSSVTQAKFDVDLKINGKNLLMNAGTTGSNGIIRFFDTDQERGQMYAGSSDLRIYAPAKLFVNTPVTEFNGGIDVNGTTVLQGGGADLAVIDGTIMQFGHINAAGDTYTNRMSLNINGQLYMEDGTHGLPQYAFLDDTNSGVRKVSNNVLALVTSGVDGLILDANQDVQMAGDVISRNVNDSAISIGGGYGATGAVITLTGASHVSQPNEMIIKKDGSTRILSFASDVWDFQDTDLNLFGGTFRSWASGYDVVQYGDFNAVMHNHTDSNSWRMSNAYFDGAWKRASAGYATNISQAHNQINFLYATTGATDSTISWSTGLSFDATTAETTFGGALSAGGHISAGVDKSFYVRGPQNAYRGLVPDTDINLMIGTGASSEPRIYLYGGSSGSASAGDVFIGSANNTGTIELSGTAKVVSDIILGGSSIYRTVANDVMRVSGGASDSLGFNWALYGESHATRAGDLLGRVGTTAVIEYDDSAGEWDFQDKDIKTTGSVIANGKFSIGDEATLTISGGAITITKSFHKLAVESGSTDDLTTINGGSNGDILVLRPDNDSEDIVVKDGGTLALAGDFTMDNSTDMLVLIHDSGLWVELSRSNNG